MEFRLHDLLVADELPVDPDGDPGGDARDRWARIVGYLTVAVVALAAAAAVIVLRPGTRPAQVGEDVTAPPLTTPDRRPTALPTGPVGAAAFGYLPCRPPCDPTLVASDGRQFSLPAGEYALSPDGRWLARGGAGGVEFRDLVAGTTVGYVDDGPGPSAVRAWSPDGRWALVVRSDPAADGTTQFTAVGVATGERNRVPVDEISPVAIRDDGTVLSWIGGERLIGAALSGGTVVPRDEVVPDLRSLIKGGELVRAESLSLDPAGALAMLTVYEPAPDGGPGRAVAVLLVDLADGHAVGRLDPGTGIWSARALVPGGILLVMEGPDRTELVRLDEASGARVVQAVVPAGAELLVRGAGVSPTG